MHGIHPLKIYIFQSRKHVFRISGDCILHKMFGSRGGIPSRCPSMSFSSLTHLRGYVTRGPDTICKPTCAYTFSGSRRCSLWNPERLPLGVLVYWTPGLIQCCFQPGVLHTNFNAKCMPARDPILFPKKTVSEKKCERPAGRRHSVVLLDPFSVCHLYATHVGIYFQDAVPLVRINVR